MQLFKLLLLGFVAGLFFVAGCKHPAKNGTVVINVQANFGSRPLVLDDWYTDPDNRYMKVESLLFYLSHMYLVKNDNSLVKATDLQFFDASNPGTLSITVPGVSGDYSGITFYCGVDSITDSICHNESYVPTALQPGLEPGMYWTMLRWQFEHVDGVWGADTSVTSFNPMVYHVGGYNSMYHAVSLNSAFSVCCGSTTTKTLILDYEKIFYNGNNQVMNITTQNFTYSDIDSVGEVPIALQFASNFSQAFSLQ
jgi:hypothetical protein